jgi:hypothetical protein
MTIFILSDEVYKYAEYLDDESLKKMIKDVFQVLCNVHWMRPEDERNNNIPLEHKSHKHKEWTQWAQKSTINYWFLFELVFICLDEYYYRFDLCNELEKYSVIILFLRDNGPKLTGESNKILFPIPLVMPKKYKTWDVSRDINDVVDSYRNYYKSIIEKKIKKCDGCWYEYKDSMPDPLCDFTRICWTKRQTPEFLIFSQ